MYKQNKILKGSKGITLIALVITIIILLILVGIAIASLTGENGILSKAENAQNKTDEANSRERLQAEVLGSYEDDGKLRLKTLKENIAKNIPEAEVTGYNFPLTIKIDKNAYVVTGEGEVKTKQYTERKGIEVGDYIDYTPSTADTYPTEKLGEGYTGSASNGETVLEQELELNWRVLNINEYGDMDLISDPTSKTVCFKGTRGYNNGVYILNDICEKLYSNKEKGITARSINLEDMEKCLTAPGKTAKAEYIANKVNKLNVNNYIESINKENNEVTYIKERSYYPVLWKLQNNENEKYYTENTLIKEDEQGKSYNQEEKLTIKQTYYQVSIDEENYGKGSQMLSYTFKYWIASRYVNSDSSYAHFGLRYANTRMGGTYLLYSVNHSYDGKNCLRAIVTLGSDVQVTPSTGENKADNPHHIN